MTPNFFVEMERTGRNAFHRKAEALSNTKLKTALKLMQGNLSYSRFQSQKTFFKCIKMAAL